MCQNSLFCWILNPEWNASKLGDYFRKKICIFFEIFEVFYCLGQLLSKTSKIYDENLGFSWFFVIFPRISWFFVIFHFWSLSKHLVCVHGHLDISCTCQLQQTHTKLLLILFIFTFSFYFLCINESRRKHRKTRVMNNNK